MPTIDDRALTLTRASWYVLQQMRSGASGNVADSEFQKATDDFLREAELLKTLDHPNVVHLLGVSMDDPDNIDDATGGVSGSPIS